jgi:hypothetical protein
MSRMILCSSGCSLLIFTLETMAAHRASTLLAILPIALQTGYSEVVPEHESLKVHYA